MILKDFVLREGFGSQHTSAYVEQIEIPSTCLDVLAYFSRPISHLERHEAGSMWKTRECCSWNRGSPPEHIACSLKWSERKVPEHNVSLGGSRFLPMNQSSQSGHDEWTKVWNLICQFLIREVVYWFFKAFFFSKKKAVLSYNFISFNILRETWSNIGVTCN